MASVRVNDEFNPFVQKCEVNGFTRAEVVPNHRLKKEMFGRENLARTKESPERKE